MATLKNTTINDTGFLQLPTGTTAQRPGSAQQGQLRYNTETRNVEWYDSTYDSWFPTGVVPPIATGGTITNITQGGVNYRVHTFTTTGTSTFTVTRGGQIEYLIVAGGGGGVGSNNCCIGAGGGGAGGYLTGITQVSAGTYSITVGPGGTGAQNGTNSSAFGLTAFGGGYGARYTGAANVAANNASNGGSGGGGTHDNIYGVNGSGTAGQGNSGGPNTGVGVVGGGGGGAGEPGFIGGAVNGNNGRGGTGIASSITGVLVYRAGGGGGSVRTNGSGVGSSGGLGGGGTGYAQTATGGTDGQANTGGGGGGGVGGNSLTHTSGGSGIVIVRYRTS